MYKRGNPIPLRNNIKQFRLEMEIGNPHIVIKPKHIHKIAKTFDKLNEVLNKNTVTIEFVKLVKCSLVIVKKKIFN